ncbi:hypothetical protein NAT51_04565 [Flavobacterium amniphilum]|uniref:hypothetical protein n=1 Tax=Flavobacterium amniphilum TaxID=1834035 RepID=UPI00202A6558|nr:hypothetical protein [Flavobacterium amniphilum]MCL9804780.1 hypothetical protein [Flavobacterium amniphilum]
MTFEEALKMIETHGEYHNYLDRTFKTKVLPKNPNDLMTYFSDLFVKRIYISNEDAKKYSSDNHFQISSFDIDFIND